LLQGSSTLTVTVIGFPSGLESTSTKVSEAKQAIQNGAQELDMVLQMDALKSGNFSLVFEDIQAVVEASLPYPVKVILETSELSDDLKIVGAALAKAA